MEIPVTMKLLAALGLLLLCLSSLPAQTVQNFEGIADNTALTTQLTGLTFTGSSVYTSGISLNNAQYPPRSGVNVVTNTTGSSITITFATPIPSVSGYYTYSGGNLTVQAFSATSALLATATSAFANNTALSGALGSSPNELITVSSPGIASITITGTGVNSFTLDDLTYGAATTVPTVSVPAIGGLIFLLALLGCFAAGRQARAGGVAALMLLTLLAVPRPAHALPAGATASLAASPQFGLLVGPNTVNFTCTVSGSQALANTVTLVRTDTTPQQLIGNMTFSSGALPGSATYVLSATVTMPTITSNQNYTCTIGNGLSTLRAKATAIFVGAGI
jgi:hypothetical protein